MAKTKSIPLPTLTEKTIARHWARAGKRGDNECWLWTGNRTTIGYGVLYWRPKGNLYAHRVAYFLAYGVDPGAFHVCHRCDQPSCVNPAHLFLGTDADNVHDAIAKGRMLQGEKNGEAKLTGGDIPQIRTLHATGKWTHCKLAAKFGVSQTAIRHILRGNTWKHI
jgi:hypothetical protein